MNGYLPKVRKYLNKTVFLLISTKTRQRALRFGKSSLDLYVVFFVLCKNFAKINGSN